MWHEADAFLHDPERVEHVQVRLGYQVKIWYLNLTGKSRKTLEMIGFKDMLEETVEVIEASAYFHFFELPSDLERIPHPAIWRSA